LVTKLYIPPARPDRVPRHTLIARLNAALRGEAALILLSAPAGSGKTSLISEWIAQNQLPTAWISLDERDNEPSRFGQYLAAALGTLEIGLDPRTSHWASISLDSLITQLINHLAETASDCVLVLEDYHVIIDPAIHEALRLLIEHCPPQLHLVITTRADPPWPLAQLRTRGQLMELRGGDLRFTLDEAQSFLNQIMGLDLPGDAVAALKEKTDGWIAGLQLAALALHAPLPAQAGGDRAAFIQAFAGSHRSVVDYLAEQVLSRQPIPVQRFLLETSILERLSGPLCEAVTGQGQAQARLEALERANLFLIPQDDQRRWYRYHPLFADFLRARLRELHPERWQELHHRAAEWCERNGLLAQAVEHALAVDDSEQATRLVEQIAESIWRRGEMMRLLGWLEALPESLLRARPRLCVFHAWTLNIVGRFELVQQRLNEAELGLAHCPEPEQRTARGMLAATRAIVAAMDGRTDQVKALVQQALDDLPEKNLVWRSVVTRNLGNAYLLEGQTDAACATFSAAVDLSHRADNIYMAIVSLYELAEAQLVQGRLHQAAQTCEATLRLADAKGAQALTVTGAVHIALGEVLYQWNALDESLHQIQTGLEIGRRGHSLGVQVCGYTRLGRVARARGDAPLAEEAFQQAMRLAPVWRRTSFVAHHDAQAQLWRYQPNVLQLVEASGTRWPQPPDYMAESAHLTLARAWLHHGRVADTLELLNTIRPSAEAAGRLGRVIEMRVLEALAHHANGDARGALAALEHALALAEPEGHVRVFVDEGAPLQTVMSQWALEARRHKDHDETMNRLLAFAEGLLAAFPNTNYQFPITSRPPPVSSFHASLVEPLSDREQEILHLIAGGLSGQAIAQRLVLALSTVQWHLKNIYGKLNVHSRTQAVARARELGLLN
jgi:LuxR family maltose regulon positive regulatory protein